MARKKSTTLTDAEAPLMEILWEKGGATVNDVMSALPKSRRLAYNTVLTTLRILEQKGYVRHIKDGRAFTYLPAVDRTRAQQRAVRTMLTRFFDNSPALLAQRLLEDENITPEALQELHQLLADKIEKSEEVA